MNTINKKSIKETLNKGKQSIQHIYDNYRLPNYLNTLLDYIEKKQNITYVTAVVHIKKSAFSFNIYSDVTYRNDDGTVDIDMNALQSSILIDAIPEHVAQVVDAESEYSVGFNYEDLQKLFNNRKIKVDSVMPLSEVISECPNGVDKITIKDNFFYTTIEYFNGGNKTFPDKHVEYITGVSVEDSPYPLDEIEITDI